MSNKQGFYSLYASEILSNKLKMTTDTFYVIKKPFHNNFSTWKESRHVLWWGLCFQCCTEATANKWIRLTAPSVAWIICYTLTSNCVELFSISKRVPDLARYDTSLKPSKYVIALSSLHLEPESLSFTEHFLSLHKVIRDKTEFC